MSAFHQCLGEAGVSWHSVDFSSGIGVGRDSPTSSLGRWDKLEKKTAETNSTAMGDDAPGGPDKVIGNRVGAGSDNSQGGSCFSGVSSAEKGGEEREGSLHRASTLVHSQGSLLWCHPGDLERVRFCVCGRDR